MSVPNVNLFLGYVNSLRGNTDKNYVKENFDARRFYGSGKEYDYVKYVSTGSKEKLDYVAYSGDNEKSAGIFDKNGLLDEEQTKKLRDKLRKTNSTIWHGVISFTESFGKQYCYNYEKAYELMKSQLPAFFKNANLNPENIIWFAGLHENTDNLHIHFSFFENQPLREKQNSDKLHFSDGFIKKQTLAKFKLSIEKHFLTQELNVAESRKLATENFKNLMTNGEVMKKLKNLTFILPARGRISYDSENMAKLRPTVDNIVNIIISTNKEMSISYNNFITILAKRDNEMLKAYSKLKIDCKNYLLYDKCVKDLYRRLGNIVIFATKDIKNAYSRVEYETQSRLAQKRIEKSKRRILIKKCLQLNDLVDREMMNAFAEYRELLQEANYKRLVEEGTLE